MAVDARVTDYWHTCANIDESMESHRRSRSIVQSDLEKGPRGENLFEWLSDAELSYREYHVSINPAVLNQLLKQKSVISKLDLTKINNLLVDLQYILTCITTKQISMTFDLAASIKEKVMRLENLTIHEFLNLKVMLTRLGLSNLAQRIMLLDGEKEVSEVLDLAKGPMTYLQLINIMDWYMDKRWITEGAIKKITDLILNNLDALKGRQIIDVYIRLQSVSSWYISQLTLQALHKDKSFKKVVRSQLVVDTIDKLGSVDLGVATGIFESLGYNSKVEMINRKHLSVINKASLSPHYNSMRFNFHNIYKMHQSKLFLWSQSTEKNISNFQVYELAYEAGLQALMNTLTYLTISTLPSSNSENKERYLIRAHTQVRKLICLFGKPMAELDASVDNRKQFLTSVLTSKEPGNCNKAELLYMLTRFGHCVSKLYYKNGLFNKVMINEIMLGYYLATRDTQLYQASFSVDYFLKLPSATNEFPILALLWVLDRKERPTKREYDIVYTALKALQRYIYSCFDGHNKFDTNSETDTSYLEVLFAKLRLLANNAESPSTEKNIAFTQIQVEETKEGALKVLHDVVDMIQAKWIKLAEEHQSIENPETPPYPKIEEIKPKPKIEESKLKPRIEEIKPKIEAIKPTSKIEEIKPQPKASKSLFTSFFDEKKLLDSGMEMFIAENKKSSSNKSNSWNNIRVTSNFQENEVSPCSNEINNNKDMDKEHLGTKKVE